MYPLPAQCMVALPFHLEESRATEYDQIDATNHNIGRMTCGEQRGIRVSIIRRNLYSLSTRTHHSYLAIAHELSSYS